VSKEYQMPKAVEGETVMVFADPRFNNGADVAPAVITRAWHDRCVNIRVHYDAPAVAPEGSGRQDWMTSVTLFGTREEAEASHAQVVRNFEASGSAPPARPYGAFWPPHAASHQEATRAAVDEARTQFGS
jgi:hypothetical protein